MALSLIVFDCDGVILESVDAKTKAFGQVAEPLGAEARDRLLVWHTEERCQDIAHSGADADGKM